ncbi:hypothetical protein I79_007833 [Cricetulus griseus]|uniref:Uncharacterized protein n=1 Tax=Cricetulus griseus TaxID=10029 RepID=G3HBK1_CRIGR|nr:hypothetical protein I79_007833 [Cricetulus griseus]
MATIVAADRSELNLQICPLPCPALKKFLLIIAASYSSLGMNLKISRLVTLATLRAIVTFIHVN